MIARTKVNYGVGDLLRAAFTSERTTRWRDDAARRLGQHVGGEAFLTASGRGAMMLALQAMGHTPARPWPRLPRWRASN
jgi:hypothetical protein